MHKRRVVASEVTRSGAGMGASWGHHPPILGAAETPGETPADKKPEKPEEKPAEPPFSPDEGFGAYLRSRAKSEEAKASEAPAKPQSGTPSTYLEQRRESITSQMRRPQSNSPPPTPAPAPQTASSLQKMREQGMYRNQYFKDAECFDCGHKFKTGRSARSANCPTCGAYISLEDVEVNMISTQAVKTRGNVVVRKRGRLSTSSVFCRDLECHGIIEANVTCSGDASFRTTGSIIGEIRCHRLVVEKGADVAFLNPIHATEVEIQARVTVSIFSTGSVVIGGNGSVNGDVTARSVSIEPGGELNGAMNIVRSKAQSGPTPFSP
ncbi:MAG: polymer-forming cytoskeletal protein [Verrucomicrobiaceae bacterium]